MILPVLLQWSVGGFAASGAVVIWSVLAPTGALMFAGTTRAIPWFAAYVLLMIISGILSADPYRQPLPLPTFVIVISFVSNIGGVSAIVFFLLKFFVHAREQAMTALEKEHGRVRQSLSLAMEVQQNLLPQDTPWVPGLDIAGTSIYCDEPAIIYSPESGDFDELAGRGSLPLGIADSYAYKAVRQDIAPGQVIAVATDGIFETQNPAGEMFGRGRFYDIIRRNATRSAGRILEAVLEAVDNFRNHRPAEDDLTLVVVKIEANP